MTVQHELMIVDDDPVMVQALGAMVADLGRVQFALDAEQAWERLLTVPPDVLLLDVDMPGQSGFALCQRIKQDPRLVQTAVIFVTSHHDPSSEVHGFDAGAVDYIHKPPSAALVHARVRTHLKLKQLSDALRHAADFDALTGMANRRHFNTTLDTEWRRARRSGASVALLLVDIDHFKHYNDHHGHPAGDRCLQAASLAMAGAVKRPADLLARYGGEEFVLLLPETDMAGALAVGQRLIELVDRAALHHGHSPVAAHVTVSVGVSAALANTCEPADLLNAADKALYAAKAAGRHGLQCAAPAAASCAPLADVPHDA